MSEQAYVVLPVQAVGRDGENADEVASAIQQSLKEKLNGGEHQESTPREDGPLRKVIANQDSLYKYISWENPVRTLGSYLGLLGLIYGVHYLHLTQMVLKIGASGLGAVILVALISRSTKSDFFARARPEYKQIPESTLNATLKDVHDLAQYSVVEAQKIIYAEDLRKTLGAFVGCTAMFWLLKVLSPFNVAILGLTLLYMTPLVTSPRGREVAQNAKAGAQELAHATSENTRAIAQYGNAKAADLSSMTQQTAAGLSSKVKQTAGDISSQTQNTTANLSSQAQQTAENLSSQAQQTYGNLTSKAQNATQSLSGKARKATDDTPRSLGDIGNVGEQESGADSNSRDGDTTANGQRDNGNVGGQEPGASNYTYGKGAAAGLPNQTRDTTYNISGASTGTARTLPNVGNATTIVPGTTRSVLGNVQQ
ncbi:Reticulon-domain-containing protein [Nemania sp. NC0429]|nr:Reticulon-domain-containing protein [Nemania sp. NC0429]